MRHNQAHPRRFLSHWLTLLSLLMTPAGLVAGQAKPNRPPQFGSHPDLSVLDPILQNAVDADEIPGAVVLVGHEGRVYYRKAFGHRALVPRRERMTTDTIFDLASLTKIVATAPSVMKLVELGKLRLDDPVARYIPEFGAKGKEQITVRMLLTHTSGLAPDPPLSAARGGRQALLKEIDNESLIAPPGTRFIYSDTGFIVLGELVERVSGLPLDVFADHYFFEPLGMRHTRFRPPRAWLSRIAPTEVVHLPDGAKPGSRRGYLLRGVVHDPRARAMGGVAGHAGLFSTAGDLAIFCQMMLDGGRIPGRAGKRVLAAATAHKMITPETPPWSPSVRGFGWDIDSAYSAARGELFPVGSYGHTGFTGTSFWIDPASKTFVILLANSVHPYERRPISSLRSRVATAVAAAFNVGDRTGIASALERSLGAPRPYGLDGVFQSSDETLTGIDVLESEGFAPLQGKRIGLITNQTGIDRAGHRTRDILGRAPGVKLVALFSPEHGIAGREDARLSSTTDALTGLPIYSLYGQTLRPTPEMLRGMDALVCDIQDAGVRFFTYIATMAYAMEGAAKERIPFYVLDRPDPLDGVTIEGPMLDPDKLSFTGYFSMPVRYAMTLGELAKMFNAENKIGAELHVIPMKDWHREDRYEATGLAWIQPSPNLRSLDAELLYPGIEILQAGGVSVGRGTDSPFELFGAPWIHGPELARELNARFVPGVRFVAARFTPQEGLYKGEPCQGAAVVITDRASLDSMLMGLEVASALHKLYPKHFELYPKHFELDKIIELLGSAKTIEQLARGEAPARIVIGWTQELERFREIRKKYLIYPQSDIGR